MTIGQHIRAARTAAGWSQAEVATRMGVTPSTYADCERGRRRPRIDTLQRIADALGCPLAKLLP